MTSDHFHLVLDEAVSALSQAAQAGKSGFDNSKNFEKRVLSALRSATKNKNMNAEPSWHPHAFPDIVVNGHGIEVKYTTKDSWLAVGNSIFESMREDSTENIYVVFGKMGGWPEVRWARYEDCITHVRISHAPRFVIEMNRASPLFGIMGVSYDDFRQLSPEDKMRHVREYSRNRLKPGERLWWLEDREEQEHTIPMEIRLYRLLPQSDKRKLRAEAALLCPEICGSSRQKGKYDGAAIYLLTHHGVFAPQTRDLFSAGSVALRQNSKRGGNYKERALLDIEDAMLDAAKYLDDELIAEYWGFSCPTDKRIEEWIKLADQYATDWKPSDSLFLESEHG